MSSVNEGRAMKSDIPPGSMKLVRVGDKEVVVANIDGKLYAIGNKCTHMGGPLAKGKLNGSLVQCPWHGSRFDIRTGAVVGPPATVPEETFEVVVEDDTITIRKSL